MRALITGGTGFVGRHLARRLEASGAEVVSLSSNASERTSDIRDFRLLDIRDGSAVETLLDQVRPAQIYHLAAVTSISAAMSDERGAFDINVWGTRNVISGAAHYQGDVRTLNVSTSQVYGDRAVSPIAEDTPVCPQNTYAATKAMGELLCQQYAAKGDIINVRPFNHSGPGQSPAFVLSFLAHQIAMVELERCEPVLRTGDLSVKRDFSDVRDVVRAYILLLEKGIAGRTYNVCSGKAYRISDALDYLLGLSDVRIRVEQDPTKARKSQSQTVFGDFERLSFDTGWKPAISFEQMLADILQYWRQELGRQVVKQAVSG